MSDKNDPVIVMARRSPVGKAFKGGFAQTRPDDLGAATISGALADLQLDTKHIDDLLLGCAMTEGEQAYNIARQVGMLAGLPESTAAATINRFCSSSAQTIGLAAAQIKAGWSQCILSGGIESMTLIPMVGLTPERYVNPRMKKQRPTFYMGMGETAEEVASRHGITREDQDRFALQSHERALAAQDAGRFDDEIVPVATTKDGEPVTVSADEGPRRGTSMEALAGLPTVFKKEGGTVTPGNASQMSDGASATLVTSRGFAEDQGLPILARVVGQAVVGVEPEVMGIGPVPAVRKLLGMTGKTIADVDLMELNEAFASQAVYCTRELGIDLAKVNVNGGAIALGHPLGATGGKLAATLIHELRRRGGGIGVETMCVGAGQGYAIMFETE